MVEVRFEDLPSFIIIGKKIWISGQENEIFGEFWQHSNENGLVEELKDINRDHSKPILNSTVFGVSCVEKDPSLRSFSFFIATEADSPDNILAKHPDLEIHTIPACQWAVFSNEGTLPLSLVDAEMYAFTDWLPSSPYLHAYAPEMELYPPNPTLNSLMDYVEFWLPITPK